MKEKKVRSNSFWRTLTQALSFAFHNGYLHGWTKGRLYTGDNKTYCLPGLNCYSCPGALGACPVGSLQALLGSSEGFKAALYALGFIGMVGILCGRFVCGWLCPFGFVQDLLHKIPLFKKRKTLPGHRYLKFLKYVVLGVLVILLPLLIRGVGGKGEPWFCEWICPSGLLLGGIPNLIANPRIGAGIGLRFIIKMAILITLLVLSVKIPRPFCKYLCPLGAMYSLCNPVSTYRLKIDADKCISCGACRQVCPMDIQTFRKPNSLECIRCGKCMAACPTGSITSTWGSLLDIRKGKPPLVEEKQGSSVKADQGADIPSTKQTVLRALAAVISAGCGAYGCVLAVKTVVWYVQHPSIGELTAYLNWLFPVVAGLCACIFTLFLAGRILPEIGKGASGGKELREFARFILIAVPVLCFVIVFVAIFAASALTGLSGQVFPDAAKAFRTVLRYFALAEGGTMIAALLLKLGDPEAPAGNPGKD